MLSTPRDSLNKFKKELHTNSRKNPKRPPSRTLSTHCERWGKTPSHARLLNCLEKEATCHKCSSKGHRASFCKSWTVGEIEEDYAFLGEIVTKTGEKFTSAELFVNNSPIHFKIYTRTDVIVIPESIHENITPAPDLLRPTKTLFVQDRCSPFPGLFYRRRRRNLTPRNIC